MVENTIRNLGRIGLIGRFKPFHNGAFVLLEAACEKAGGVIIGIGSANKYNARNPFTKEETKEMIERALKDRFSNYQIVYVPDFGHIPEFRDGKKWREFVKNAFGTLDHFISGNKYVQSLLENDYDIIQSYEIVSPEKRIPLRAAEVRYQMAVCGNWKDLVPREIAGYLEEKNLVERFRKEFGLQTLASLASGYNPDGAEKFEDEKLHVEET